MTRFFLLCLLLAGGFILPAHAALPGQIRWGADAEGGAPYIFPDPANPSKLIGFEVDLADALSAELHRPFVVGQNTWDNLVPALRRGDIDLIINGLEVTPERQQQISFSIPYYAYSEQVLVRRDETRIKGFDDLKGHTVGTLGASVAERLLRELPGMEPKLYSDMYAIHRDLALGRLDAVFLDGPCAAFYAPQNPTLMPVGKPVGNGVYAIGVRLDDTELRRAVDGALRKLYAEGRIEQIMRKWRLFDDAQIALAQNPKLPEATPVTKTDTSSRLKYLPLLLEGAVTTLWISCVAMFFAVALGLTLAMIRLFAPAPFAWLAIGYIEIVRGTPLLIQLYLLYYGLPSLGIKLSPTMAAITGLALNYAAYEAENYRAGIRAIPKGQLEAAYALGMTRMQALVHVIMPQAVRVALPSVTNDFIALFKDSSLVSVITMVELTKVYGMLASTTYDYIGLGLITAAIYFGIGYPVARFASWLERRLDIQNRPAGSQTAKPRVAARQ
ncbi:MAG: ABC transporter permease subunit [Candidatus Sericytochromatia bacterium]|nr:ABC transporter permease subunit [Candidatus Sericytochromatia bacterium]